MLIQSYTSKSLNILNYFPGYSNKLLVNFSDLNHQHLNDYLVFLYYYPVFL